MVMAACHSADIGNKSKETTMSKPTMEELRARLAEKQAKYAERAREIESMPTQKKQKSPWEPLTVDLYSTSGQKPVRIHAQESCYLTVAFRFRPGDCPVTAFVSPTGNVWVGPPQDFYIETERGIIGGKEQHSSEILWCKSMIQKHTKEKSNLDSVIRRFENEVDGRSLGIASGFYEDPHTGKDLPGTPEARSKRETDLLDVLGDFYGARGNRGGRIAGIEVKDDTVRLDLKGAGSATVWIDINSKKLLKAIKNGKQVWPKGGK